MDLRAVQEFRHWEQAVLSLNTTPASGFYNSYSIRFNDPITLPRTGLRKNTAHSLQQVKACVEQCLRSANTFAAFT